MRARWGRACSRRRRWRRASRTGSRRTCGQWECLCTSWSGDRCRSSTPRTGFTRFCERSFGRSTKPSPPRRGTSCSVSSCAGPNGGSTQCSAFSTAFLHRQVPWTTSRRAPPQKRCCRRRARGTAEPPSATSKCITLWCGRRRVSSRASSRRSRCRFSATGSICLWRGQSKTQPQHRFQRRALDFRRRRRLPRAEAPNHSCWRVLGAASAHERVPTKAAETGKAWEL
mmetsp:Transcript_30505/g.99147  ORF Transcript_30505/g.99147 Transcript_30505/m.99147 type:complete len:227 (-) Transcript_30505:608-1288(-)